MQTGQMQNKGKPSNKPAPPKVPPKSALKAPPKAPPKAPSKAPQKRAPAVAPTPEPVIEEDYTINEPVVDKYIHKGGLGCAYFEAMNKYKQHVAQISVDNCQIQNYENLLNCSVRTALWMRKQGIIGSDVVLTCTFNDIYAVVPFIAATFLGSLPCTLYLTKSGKENQHLMSIINPKIVFVHFEMLEDVQETLNKNHMTPIIVILGKDTKKNPSYSQIVKKPMKEESTFKPVCCRDINDTAAIVFSNSGGELHKGICVSHYGLLYQSTKNFMGIDVFMTFSTLFWISNIINHTTCILQGKTKVLSKEFDATKLWKWINMYKINYLMLPPHLLVETMYARQEDADISCLKLIVVSGSAISVELLGKARNMFAITTIVLSYGQTENCGSTISYEPQTPEELELLYSKGATIGKLLSGNICKVVDLNTQKILGPFKKGELLLKSNFLYKGFYHEESSQILDEEGWFRTGDLVYFDKDRFFYFVDRCKDLLKYGGHHVSPSILEAVLMGHPAVLHAAVVGIQHPFEGELPTAFICLKEGDDVVTAEEIKAYHDDLVDDHQKLRGGVYILDKIPLTHTNRVSKMDLKELIPENISD